MRKAEREMEEYAAIQRFFDSLSKINSYVEAQVFAVRGPRSGSPGGQHYSNLAFFLMHFFLPDGAKEEECIAYVRLLRRISEHEPGLLKDGVLASFEGAFNAKYGHLPARSGKPE